MGQYFTYYDYAGPPFQLWGFGHLFALAIIAVIIIFLIWGWKDPSEQVKKRTRIFLASVLLFSALAWQGWNLYQGSWDIRDHLPLHLCSVMFILATIMLLGKNQKIFEVIYFLALAGAIQPLLTPGIRYSFPHFRAIQIFVIHGALVISVVYMATIEKFRPTWKSIGKMFIYANLYMFIIYFVNLATEGNYLYLVHKPYTPSLLDLLGPWPYYIISMELVGLFLSFLLYLPFAIRDWQDAQKTALGT